MGQVWEEVWMVNFDFGGKILKCKHLQLVKPWTGFLEIVEFLHWRNNDQYFVATLKLNF
jgi:hypothetical protein